MAAEYSIGGKVDYSLKYWVHIGDKSGKKR